MRASIVAILIMIGVASKNCWSAEPLAAAPLPNRLTIASWNLEWFFDDQIAAASSDLAKEHAAPSAAAWAWRVKAAAGAIAKFKPTILCLQEIEDQKVLDDLAGVLRRDHGLVYQVAFFEGNDTATEQDVAILWQSGMVNDGFRFRATAAQKRDPALYAISKHLAARFVWGTGAEREEVLLVNLHLRATAESSTFRIRQARQLWAFLEGEKLAGVHVVVLGDVNTEVPYDKTTRESDIGMLRRMDNAIESDDLVDLHKYLPEDGRKTHRSGQFDRILVSGGLVEDSPGRRDFVFRGVAVRQDACANGKPDDSHGTKYWKIPEAERDVSDHWPLVAELELK